MDDNNGTQPPASMTSTERERSASVTSIEGDPSTATPTEGQPSAPVTSTEGDLDTTVTSTEGDPATTVTSSEGDPATMDSGEVTCESAYASMTSSPASVSVESSGVSARSDTGWDAVSLSSTDGDSTSDPRTSDSRCLKLKPGSGGSPAQITSVETVVNSPNRAGFELLKKLESANRCLEADGKAKQSLSSRHNLSPSRRRVSCHSRNASLSSITSWGSIDLDTAPIDDIWAIWGRVVHNWDNYHKNRPQELTELIRRGIPEHFRGIVWPLLCDAENLTLLYADCLKKKSAYEKVIRRDVNRTYPEVEKFKSIDGQQSLFNVMKAYSIHDKEVGYCQGCCFLTGLLLMQMPDEQSFSVLNSIMFKYKLRELFKPSMARLTLCLYQLNALLYEQVPDLMKHFEAQDFNMSMFASQWFLTLFTNSMSLSLSTRVFDIFLVEGLEIIFRLSLAIFMICEDDLLSLDMEGVINYMQKRLVPKIEVDPDKLFGTAFNIKYSHKKMASLEKEYTNLKNKDQEGQVELRRLRTENRLLQQRIDNMEKETVTLADRLVHDQVRVARAQEEIGSLKNDLCVSEDSYHDLVERLLTSQRDCEKLRKCQAKAPSIEHMASAEQLAIDLQKELIDSRYREVDAESAICELHSRITELENAQRELQKEPSAEIACLQEQLVACKLREAEANLSMKELQQKVVELDRHWKKYEHRFGKDAPAPAPGTAQRLASDIMTMRVHEATVCAELQDSKKRVLELETQNHIYSRQIMRLDVDKERLQEQLDNADTSLNSSKNDLETSQRSLDDLQNKIKEDTMLSAITNAEYSQSIADMRRRIAELEIENQELLTSSQLQVKRPNSSSPCLQSSPPTNGQLDLDEFSDIEDDDDLLSGHELSIVLDVSSHCNRDDSIDSDADVEAAIANGLLHFDDQGEQFNSDEADTVAPPPPQQQQVSQGHVVDFNNAIPQTS